MVKLIVFDFHGTLSLKQGSSDHEMRINNLKVFLRGFKKDGEKMNWYILMKKSNIKPNLLMPTLDDIIYFIKKQNDSIFGIASVAESESFILDMMRYCFESKNMKSPFTIDNVVSSGTLFKYGQRIEQGKLKHITVILKNLNLDIPYSSVTLIDDTESMISDISYLGVCGILVEDGFRISDWNKGCYKHDNF